MSIKKISRCPKCHEIFPSSRRSRLCDACYYKETTVVNWQQERFDVYIGRFNYRASLMCATSQNITGDLIHLSSKGFFGNPFLVSEHGREEALRKFRKYFYERLADDETFLAIVLDLKGLVLGCWCKPAACHGDILADFLNAVKDVAAPLHVKEIIKQKWAFCYQEGEKLFRCPRCNKADEELFLQEEDGKTILVCGWCHDEILDQQPPQDDGDLAYEIWDLKYGGHDQ